MEDQGCPKFRKCPIFQKNVFYNEETSKTFRMIYCDGGKEKYNECKRYLASEITGHPVPENILPNSKLTVNEIIKVMVSSLN